MTTRYEAPYIGIGGHYYEVKVLQGVWQHLAHKALSVAAGLDAFNPAECFAYAVLYDDRYRFLRESTAESTLPHDNLKT